MSPSETPTGPREYNERSQHRHATNATSSSRSLRRTYFGLCAVWGFAAGVAGLMATLSLTGQPMEASAGVALGLIGALVVAFAGGWVLAGAYQEAKRRRH